MTTDFLHRYNIATLFLLLLIAFSPIFQPFSDTPPDKIIAPEDITATPAIETPEAEQAAQQINVQ